MILVTGGAGYVGSHMIKMLLRSGYDVLCYDNLSTGNIEAVDAKAKIVIGDLRDASLLSRVFKENDIEAVLHFAASCYVGESSTIPLEYYDNNIISSISLLKQMINHGVKRIVFSSTCAVYGSPNFYPIEESSPTVPINPYGMSKLAVEHMIKDLSRINEVEYMILRYFNVAGADPSGKIGECHEPETHLIPNIINHLLNKSESITIYGEDYDTPDGTCIRDYIHVNDLCEAHILVLETLLKNGMKNEVFNVGLGKGHSVRNVIKVCENVTGKNAVIRYSQKRTGDPSCLIAASSKIREKLGWFAKFTLEDMVASAYSWHRAHPNGYKN